MANEAISREPALEQTIAVTTHGRYLVEPAAGGEPAPLLVGCHGYGESAETQMERLRTIPGADRWTLVAVQGLHRFYDRRNDAVVASWMTRQDREQAIADNLAYCAAVVEAEWRSRSARRGVVFAGFSQGVAMAFRAAAASARPVLGVIAVGGDVPPELDRAALSRIGHAVLLRGERDQWYTTPKFEQDRARLRDAGAVVTAVPFDGGHEWSAPVLEAAALFLKARLA
jgi:predicted esterase